MEEKGVEKRTIELILSEESLQSTSTDKFLCTIVTKLLILWIKFYEWILKNAIQ